MRQKLFSWLSMLLVSFVLISFCSGETLPHFSTQSLHYQKDSPIQLVSVSTSTTFLFNGALIMNAGSEILTALRIGVVLKDESGTILGHRITEEIGLVVPSGRSVPLHDTRWVTLEVLRQAAELDVRFLDITFGVVSATFREGDRFLYNLDEFKDFALDDRHPQAIDAHRRIEPELIEDFIRTAARRADENHERLMEVKGSDSLVR
jgi:hypothetical protein